MNGGEIITNMLGRCNKHVRNVTNSVCFIVILCFVLNKLTWLYRANGIESREDIIGFRNIKGDIDVVTFGSSNLLRYYIPLQAYADYGITSYNYATSSAQLDMLKFFIEDARKYQSPKLYVINVGCILYLDSEMDEMGMRNWTDSLPPLNITRLKAIHSYLSSHDYSQSDVLSYYIDIAKYHSNKTALGDSHQYELLNGKYYNLDRSFSPYTRCCSFDTPIVSEEVGFLTEYEYEVLNDLLEYCDSADINVLFMVNPFHINESECLKLNAVERLVSERGYDWVDFNDYYEDMKIDFEKDYADRGHTNYFGAKKFTDFFAKYLKQHYVLVDHRGDTRYQSWDDDVVAFAQMQEEWATRTNASIDTVVTNHQLGQNLQQINEFEKWFGTVIECNFSLLFTKSSGYNWQGDSRFFTDFIKNAGMDIRQDDFAYVYSNGKVVCSTNICGNSISGELGEGGESSVYYIATGLIPEIVIDNVTYDIETEGIFIVVFDNNYKEVYDSVTIIADDNGEILIIR